MLRRETELTAEQKGLDQVLGLDPVSCSSRSTGDDINIEKNIVWQELE